MTHWSSRLLADQLGISHSTVARLWAEHDVKFWQTEAFRFSPDPELEARVRDVVGLSLEPSAHAIVLGMDEKSQIQALERTQPSRPTPGAARRRPRRGAATHRGRLRALPVTGWRGSGRLVHTSGSYASKALLYRADAPGGSIGGKMSPKKIRQRLRLRAPLLFFDQMVPIGG